MRRRMNYTCASPAIQFRSTMCSRIVFIINISCDVIYSSMHSIQCKFRTISIPVIIHSIRAQQTFLTSLCCRPLSISRADNIRWNTSGKRHDRKVLPRLCCVSRCDLSLHRVASDCTLYYCIPQRISQPAFSTRNGDEGDFCVGGLPLTKNDRTVTISHWRYMWDVLEFLELWDIWAVKSLIRLKLISF